MKMQHMTRLADWYVRTQTGQDRLWLLLNPKPSQLNAAYQQRQRNRRKRHR